VEVALLAPWIFFLFVGVLNFGFYAYALISIENAARAAATYTASNPVLADNTDSACRYALAELSGLPNTRTLTSCNALPVQVTAEKGQCPSLDADSLCSTVSVTYQTIRMIPIPGLAGQMTITRFVQLRADE
jgi:Flp pilus assembly protein TadG